MEYAKINESRRSINFFDPEATISVNDLKAIYDLAKLAPSSFNFQPWRVIVAHSPEIKAKLREVALKQPKVTEASAVLVLFGHTQQFVEADDVFADKIQSGQLKAEAIPSIVGMAKMLYTGRESSFAARNVGIFAMNFMLAAQDLGWETHPMDGFDVDGVQKLFGLDPKYLPVMFIAIGKIKPGASIYPRSMRRPFEQVFEIK